MRSAKRVRGHAAAARIAAAAIVLIASSRAAGAAEVNGIWSEPATKDLGELTGNDFFDGWKIRGWLEGYYEWNFNRPGEGTVDENQDLSIVKGSHLTHSGDVSIEGRTFDIHHSKTTFSMAEVELEKLPQLSSWTDPKAFGFKIDVNYGDTYEIIYDTIEGNLGDDTLNHVDRYISHYSLGYVAPMGRGLRVDFGKLVTHIGGETIETIKNNNFSHGYLYTYAIPFQDTGFRFSYPVTDTISTEFYVLQGWNVTWNDNNNGKTFGPSILWAPSPRVSMYANYLVGPEQRNDNNPQRQLVDLGLALNPVDPLNMLFSFDYGYEEDAIGDDNAHWWGIFGVFRYKVTDHFEPALRLEYFDDPDGFATGVPQRLHGVTLTLNYRIDLPKGAHILVRPEYRHDMSSANFFTETDNFRQSKNQDTIGLGMVLYY